MRIFISGSAGGSLQEAKVKIAKAENDLEIMNNTPVNPLKSDSLHDRLVLLASCEAIYLLSDWLQSKEAIMEKCYSDITGKRILFESRLEEEMWVNADEENAVLRIKGAIEEVTGLTFQQYIEEGRREDVFYARMLFSINCLQAGIDQKRIINYMPRGRTTILRYLNNYHSEFKFNPKFRNWSEKVSQKLCNESS
jgi:hypothetical protein